MLMFQIRCLAVLCTAYVHALNSASILMNAVKNHEYIENDHRHTLSLFQ